jgi:hypothetical protein
MVFSKSYLWLTLGLGIHAQTMVAKLGKDVFGRDTLQNFSGFGVAIQ